MQSEKPLTFNASAIDYFTLTVITVILTYIPFFGWAFLLNYMSSWYAERATVNGKKIVYQAGYGESLAFVTVGTLLSIVTFGIYSFWFMPKLYRYVVDHISYEDAAAPVEAPAEEPMQPPASQTPLNPVQ